MSKKQQSNDDARSDLRREENQSQYHTNPSNSGEINKVSQSVTHESIRSDRTLGETNGWKFRAARLGGIQRQLRQLQSQHLAYVEAHGQRLEARLQENRQHKTIILAEIAALEKELSELITEAKSKAQTEEE